MIDEYSQIYVPSDASISRAAAAQADEMDEQACRPETAKTTACSWRLPAAMPTQARAELERQRLQSQIRPRKPSALTPEAEAARAEGEQAKLEAESARAEAAQPRRMADAQAKAAALAKKEAALQRGQGQPGGKSPPPTKGGKKEPKK